MSENLSANPEIPAAAQAPTLAPRRLPMQERGRQTMELVLRAAGEAIERDGLDKLTTKRIAAAAGVSVGAIYEYFPNKEAIVHALADQWLGKVREAIDAVHPRHGGQRDVMSYLNEQFTLVTRLYEDRPGLGALIQMMAAMPALDSLARQHDEMVSANVSSALKHYAPHAEDEAIDAAARCIGLFCHDVLCLALVHRVAPPDRLFANLRASLVAIASPLVLARG
jgi:AcrR family transcriptional regulator